MTTMMWMAQCFWDPSRIFWVFDRVSMQVVFWNESHSISKPQLGCVAFTDSIKGTIECNWFLVRTARLCNREMGPTAHKFLQHDRTNKCPIIVYRQEDYHIFLTIGKPLLKGFLNIPSGKRLHNYGKSPL